MKYKNKSYISYTIDNLNVNPMILIGGSDYESPDLTENLEIQFTIDSQTM